jgi:tetratricopeptide (TPR) repeat protein
MKPKPMPSFPHFAKKTIDNSRAPPYPYPMRIRTAALAAALLAAVGLRGTAAAGALSSPVPLPAADPALSTAAFGNPGGAAGRPAGGTATAIKSQIDRARRALSDMPSSPEAAASRRALDQTAALLSDIPPDAGTIAPAAAAPAPPGAKAAAAPRGRRDPKPDSPAETPGGATPAAKDARRWTAAGAGSPSAGGALLRPASRMRGFRDPREALLESTAQLDKDPGSAKARAQRAEALVAVGDFEAAAAEADKALALDPASVQALNARAFASNKQGRYLPALQDADLVLKLAPDNALGHLNRALALEGLGRWAEALEEYRLAAALDPAMRVFLRDAEARHGSQLPSLRAGADALARHPTWVLAALLLAAALPLGLWLRPGPARKSRAAPAAVGAGKTVGGNYRIERLIGEGGMGKVFEGLDTVIRRKVAVKMMRAAVRRELGDDQIMEEARLAALARHPNIVEIFAVLQEDGEIFLVFEFVAGRSLSAILQAKGRLALPEVVHVLRQVAAGLDCAHAKRVIHRDLKPDNVVISNEGAAKLMDFGIARRTRTSPDGKPVKPAGTAPYMAPEQHLGEVSPESDIYALGVMAYELLTGRCPFLGADALELKKRAYFPPAGGLMPGLPPAVDAVLGRALAADPKARYHSGGEFVTALAAAGRV